MANIGLYNSQIGPLYNVQFHRLFNARNIVKIYFFRVFSKIFDGFIIFGGWYHCVASHSAKIRTFSPSWPVASGARKPMKADKMLELQVQLPIASVDMSAPGPG